MKSLLVIPLFLAGLPLTGFADTVLPGTEITVRSDSPIDVSRWDRGRIYPGYTASDVYAADGDLAIPQGAYAELIVRQIGPAQLALDLESITVNGRRYVMDAAGPNFNMQQNSYDSGSGLVGNIIGAIAGAAGAQVETQGDHIYVPAESVLRFRLQEPLHTVNWSDPGYMSNGYHHHHDHDWYR
jgi:hypothetical protein